ncbi:MAG: hypothetical protein KDD51_13375 [Bdellovibrionales bacterium]|nr:hypothetical protein [Bdellovibrionales bacterium]
MPRISTIQLYDRATSSIGESRDRESITSQKASTLKEIVRPSDDPRGWAVAQQIKDELSIQDTLSRNAALARHVLTATEDIFKQATDHVERVYELGLASIYKGQDVRTAALQEVEEVYESVIHALNARYGSRTLLGGFKSDKPAFNADGEFLGDGGSIEIELERGQRIPININGKAAISGSGQSGAVNITEVFQRLIEGLKSGDHELIGSTFPDFQKAVSQLTSVRTEIGARMNRIDRVLSSYEMESVERKEAIAELEEADPVKVFTDLARDQTALKATLDTAHKILTEVPPDKLFR